MNLLTKSGVFKQGTISSKANLCLAPGDVAPAQGSGVSVGSGGEVAVGVDVGGPGVGVAVGSGEGVGSGVSVGEGVQVEVSVGLGVGVVVGTGVGVPVAFCIESAVTVGVALADGTTSVGVAAGRHAVSNRRPNDAIALVVTAPDRILCRFPMGDRPDHQYASRERRADWQTRLPPAPTTDRGR